VRPADSSPAGSFSPTVTKRSLSRRLVELRKARIGALAVQALEHLTVDDMAVPEAKLGQAVATPPAGWLAALLRWR